MLLQSENLRDPTARSLSCILQLPLSIIGLHGPEAANRYRSYTGLGTPVCKSGKYYGLILTLPLLVSTRLWPHVVNKSNLPYGCEIAPVNRFVSCGRHN
jgi:hypothetical protein